MSLVIKNLTKNYGTLKALDNVNLEIPKGLFGLLGPNGAGKSSLMRTIATLQSPDQGSIEFSGIDVLTDQLSLRSRLGYLPQEFGVYPKTSAEDLLSYLASLKGIVNPRERKEMVESLLAMTNLTAHKKRAVASFSGGMKQRFGIAQALIGDPELLIVDEPTAGLDPEERLRFLNILSEVGQEKTIIFSTHIVGDIVDLCQKFAILFSGKILCHLSPLEALNQIKNQVWQKPIEKEELEAYSKSHNVLSARLAMGRTFVRVHSSEKIGDGFELAESSLEDFYFSKTKGYLQ
jgi:ABC-type multidrug transport system ATPase subunit